MITNQFQMVRGLLVLLITTFIMVALSGIRYPMSIQSDARHILQSAQMPTLRRNRGCIKLVGGYAKTKTGSTARARIAAIWRRSGWTQQQQQRRIWSNGP